MRRRPVERLGFYRWLRDDAASRMPHATREQVVAEVRRYRRAIWAFDAAERASGRYAYDAQGRLVGPGFDR